MSTEREKQLGMLLLKAQWQLGDAAFALKGGYCSSTEAEELASVLDELSAAIRQEYSAVVEAET